MVAHVSQNPAEAKRMEADLPSEDLVARTRSRGTARCPGPSVQDILSEERAGVPDFYLQESYRYLGDEDIPFARYTSPSFFDLEMRYMWPKVWQWACRLEQIPQVGDYIVYDIGLHSILVVRLSSDCIKAYHNSCLHRGTNLRARGSEGSATNLRCPYHGWTWNLDGTLARIPCPWDFQHVDPKKFVLPEVKVDVWGGFVFINLDSDAPPLKEYLEVLPEHMHRWEMESNYTYMCVHKRLPCNWKAAQEAFMESYHVMETHPQLMNSGTDANCQYDIYGKHVSRFLSPHGAQSPYMNPPLTDVDLLNSLLVADSGLLQRFSGIPEGETLRTVSAKLLRSSLEEALGIDLSKLSTSEIIDMAEYSLFPNMVVFSGMQLPMAYRFRPVAMDPTRSLFELYLFRRVPKTGEVPSPPAIVKLDEEQLFAEVPGLDPAFGHVFDQDTMNLRSQQEGFAAAHKKGETLGTYQEIRLRHFHQTIDSYIAKGQGCTISTNP